MSRAWGEGGAGCIKEKGERIDLGLAICHAKTLPGQTRTVQEIAAYCDCAPQSISLIYMSGLRKLRRRLFRDGDRMMIELIEQVLGKEVNTGEQVSP